MLKFLLWHSYDLKKNVKKQGNFRFGLEPWIYVLKIDLD